MGKDQVSGEINESEMGEDQVPGDISESQMGEDIASSGDTVGESELSQSCSEKGVFRCKTVTILWILKYSQMHLLPK